MFLKCLIKVSMLLIKVILNSLSDKKKEKVIHKYSVS
jgi:hypothetical protein